MQNDVVEIGGERFLTERGAARKTRLAVATLRSKACKGEGPPRILVGRKVLYRERSLLGWLLAREKDPERGARRLRELTSA